MTAVIGLLLLLLMITKNVQGNVPTFDEDTSGKQVLLLPKDTQVGSRIYRLKASDSDRDYPLHFEVSPRSPKDVIRMEQIGAQEADVVLLKQLIKVGDMYVTNISVKDSSGQATEIAFRINVTESRCSPDTVFVFYNKSYVVSEKAEVGSVIGHVLARSSDYINRDVDLQLEGSDRFAISPIWEKPKIIRGSITLTTPLDYEKQSFYALNIAAYNGYIDRSVDTRNIVYLSIYVVVADEQDTPPIFTRIPTYVQLNPDMQSGWTVLEVLAEDGDTANKRSIKYSLLSSADSHFFTMNSTSGQLVSAVSAVEISKQNGGNPILLTIQAEEVVEGGGTPNPELDVSRKQVVILPAVSSKMAPQFAQEHYEAELEEHSAASTVIQMNGPTVVIDDDQGLSGVFTLKLEDSEQLVDKILEIIPPVIVNHGSFQLRVKNPDLLDFENFHQLKFQVVAEEISDNPLRSVAEVTLNLKDINDHGPQFSKKVYEAQLAEDAKSGAFVTQISCSDPDQKSNGQISYVEIKGEKADRLHLDKDSGRITLVTSEHGFDRETEPDLWFTITATDNGNPARVNSTQLHLRLVDANDNAPHFRQDVYEVVIVPDLPLTGPVLRLDAVDGDESESNNSMVRYELISGNWGDAFDLDRVTGELRLKKSVSEASRLTGDDSFLMERDEGSYTLTVRAYDLGVPHQSSTATVYVYFKKPSSAMNVTITYIYPGSVNEINQNQDRVERMLARLNGAPTLITGVWPYQEQDNRLQRRSVSNVDKSVIRTTVRYHKTTQVDLSAVARELNATAGIPLLIDTSGGGNTQTEGPALSTAGNSDYGWKVALITLLILLAICLLILLCFCFYRQFGKLDKKAKVHPSDKHTQDNTSQSKVIEVATVEDPLVNGNEEKPKAADDNPRRLVGVNGTHERLSASRPQQQQPSDPNVPYSRHFQRLDPASGNSMRVLHDHHNVYHHHHHHLQPHHNQPAMAEIEEEAGEELDFAPQPHSTYYHPQRHRPLPPEEPVFMIEPDWPPHDYIHGDYIEPYSDRMGLIDDRMLPPSRRIWMKKYRGGGGSLPGDRFEEEMDRYPTERPKHRPRERARAVTRASFRELEHRNVPTERFIKLESGEILQLDAYGSTEEANNPTFYPEKDLNIHETNSSNVSPQSVPPAATAINTLINNNDNNNSNNIDNSDNNAPSNAKSNKIARNKSKNKSEARYMDWYNNTNNNKLKEKHKLNCDRAKMNDEINKIADNVGNRGRNDAMNSSVEAASIRPIAPGATPADNGEALDAMNGAILLGGGNSRLEDDSDDHVTDMAGQTDAFKSSRKQFMEKKSLFTIAYNKMENKQDALKEREMSANGDRLKS